MNRLEKLKEKIEELYSARNKGRADWADWLYENHIFQVVDIAGKLADKYGADRESAMAAGMLHDVADAVMKRENPEHEEKTLKIAKKFLKESDFTDEEIKIIVDDAMRLHSCHGNERPQTLEGMVMATADAVVHLQNNYDLHARTVFSKTKSAEEIRKWALAHMDKDFNSKIAFNEVREQVKANYEKLKSSYGG